MRVLICGDRNWIDGYLVKNTLAAIHAETPISRVIEGGARGADMLGNVAARTLGIVVDSYPADWRQYGKRAGPIRNYQMLKEGKPDIVLAFHDDLTKSKGTAHMVSIARNAGVLVRVVGHQAEECNG